MKIGLVLGGGGLRGLSHIGVLKVIEKLNIKISAIAGCSMGSIIGYCYAAGKTAQEIEDFIKQYNVYKVLDFSISKLGIHRITKIQKLLEDFTGIKEFNKLKIPLYINATNLSKSKEIVFSKGNIFKAIRASISIPGIFAPTKIKKDFIIDGGVLNQVPFNILPKNIKKFILVKVPLFNPIDKTEKINIGKIVESSIELMQSEILRLQLSNIKKQKYVLIKPAVYKYAIISDKKDFKNIINKGENATRKKIPEIRKKLIRKHITKN